jgi:CO/xanthine dehydrogenase Mo-binding subunit
MSEQPSAGMLRRQFLKTGGALVVGFAAAPTVSFAQNPGQLTGAYEGAAQPDVDKLDTWIAIHADNTATIIHGHHELGQGISTTLLQIAADELDLDMSQVTDLPLETGKTPNQGLTAASAGIARGPIFTRAFPADRLASSLARQSAASSAATALAAAGPIASSACTASSLRCCCGSSRAVRSRAEATAAA